MDWGRGGSDREEKRDRRKLLEESSKWQRMKIRRGGEGQRLMCLDLSI
jgi:hypothetical protein